MQRQAAGRIKKGLLVLQTVWKMQVSQGSTVSGNAKRFQQNQGPNLETDTLPLNYPQWRRCR